LLIIIYNIFITYTISKFSTTTNTMASISNSSSILLYILAILMHMITSSSRLVVLVVVVVVVQLYYIYHSIYNHTSYSTMVYIDMYFYYILVHGYIAIVIVLITF